MTPRLLDLPAAAYHADRLPDLDAPTLSASAAHTLLSKSPFHCWLHHPRLGKVAKDSSDSMDRGTILHSLVLKPNEKPPVAIIEAENFRTKQAQTDRDRAIADGLIPVLKDKWGGYTFTAQAITKELADRGVYLTGLSERAVVWEEETPFGPILCRGMIDHLWTDRAAILDLKTIESAKPDGLPAHVIKHGYHVQAAAYRSAIRKLLPDMAGRETFRLAFAEELPLGSPRRVLVTLVRLSGQIQELGDRQWSRACEVWAKCLAAGTGHQHWPDYTDGTLVEVDAPAWAMSEEIEVSV